MREIHVSVNTHQSAKQQALKIIPLLQEESGLPIQRAKMKLQLTANTDKIDQVLENLQNDIELQTRTTQGQLTVLLVLIEPKNYRKVDSTLKTCGGQCEVVQHVVKPETEERF
jgi:ribosome maturation protein SDO1